MQDQALIESVSELVTLAGDGISITLAELSPEADDHELNRALESCQGNVETIAMAADMAQLAGLQDLCNSVNTTLAAVNGQIREFQTDLGPRLLDWSKAVQRYIQQPDASGISESLLALAPSDQHSALRLALGDTELEWADINTTEVSAADTLLSTSDPAIEPNTTSSVKVAIATLAKTENTQTEVPSSTLKTEQLKVADDDLLYSFPAEYPDENNEIERGNTELEHEVATDPAETAAQDLIFEVATAIEAECPPDSDLSAITVNPSCVFEVADKVTFDNAADESEPDEIEPDKFGETTYTQLDEIFAELAPWQAILQTPSASKDELQTACAGYSQVIARVQAAGDALGLNGLGVACELLEQNIKTLVDADPTVRMAALTQLTRWPSITQRYLATPTDEQYQLATLELLMHASWPQPLPEEYAAELLEALKPDQDEYLADVEQRPTLAQSEDIDLTIDPDVNPKLLAVFMQEAPVNAADFSAAVQRIIRGDDIVKNIGSAQRLAHNLKGSANLLGVKGVANMAHHIEDILEYLSEQQIAPQPALAHTLQDAADCIEAMLESLQKGNSAPAEAQQILQSVFDWANRMDAGDLATPVQAVITAASTVASTVAISEVMPTAATATTSTAPTTAATETATHSASANRLEPAPPAPATTSAAASDKVVRVPTATIEAMFRLVGEVSIALDQLQERFEGVRRLSNDVRQQDSIVQQRRFELENFIDVRHVAKSQQRLRQLSRGQDFDPLEMDQYDELYSTTRSFIESVVDSRRITQNMRSDFTALERALAPLKRMKDDLQIAVMKTRMEPVSSITARLQRSVRQAARATEKAVDLVIEGSDIKLDSEVLDRLAEPLMHILRNAVDHGIEKPAQRSAQGKPENGSIGLRFFQDGQNVVVECSDDGAGLDYERIQKTAITKGLLPAGASANHEELARVIMTPGFSTRSSATQLSGRGVGMDIVNTAIRDLKGIIEIGDAQTGGCKISMRLPITLLTSHSLVVRVGKERYAIPTSSIMQVMSPRQGRFSKIGNQLAYEIGQAAYPAKTLSACLGYSNDTIMPADTNSIVIIYSDTGPVAIAVDQFVNSYDLVVKNLGRYVGSVRGIAGLSSLADGSLIPVLDVAELLRAPAQASALKPLAEATAGAPTQVQTAARILIVDDSISVRQTLSDLVEEAGYEAMLARDGIEAVDLLRKQTPDLVLSDIEMPRMNGLELASYIRTSHSTTLPIIMITSRTMQKHRQQASEAGANSYVTKPFDEDELLSSIRSFIQ